MAWGGGVGAEARVSVESLNDDDEAYIGRKKDIKYFAEQWVPGSKERKRLVSFEASRTAVPVSLSDSPPPTTLAPPH